MSEKSRDYNEMRYLIEAAKGRFVRVDFIKKDGTLRQMLVQPAKLKFEVKGDEASDSARKGNETYKQNNPNLMPVWDVDKQAIRSINLDTVTLIKIDGEEHAYRLAS